MRILVLGAGAWGTALAIHAARSHTVTLRPRQVAHALALRTERVNRRYLPDVSLPAALAVADPALPLAAELSHQDLLVVATPVQGLRSTFEALKAAGATQPVVWLAKGFEADTSALPHEVFAAVAAQGGAAAVGVAAPTERVAGAGGTGVLSGPSFALEVASGLPVALSAASAGGAVADCMQEAFHHGPMRLYQTSDVVGVETAGALKNVIAIALGMCDGLAQGLNARAALLTRGLAEITRLGVALGARAETFQGLSGVGDLVLTGTGGLSRNRQVGLALAQGEPLSAILQRLGHVAEGVACCHAALARAQGAGVEMPITQAVGEVLAARATPAQMMLRLMSREPRAE